MWALLLFGVFGITSIIITRNIGAILIGIYCLSIWFSLVITEGRRKADNQHEKP